MAIAHRDASRSIDPAFDPGPGVPGRPPRALQLVPDLPEAAVGGRPDLHPGQVKRTRRLSPPAGRRMAVRPGRREGSLVAYFLMLGAGALVGVQVAASFIASQTGVCRGADAPGQCILDHLAAPAVTRFALVLICAHAVASLVLDVIPEVAAKLRAGYRPRRVPRPAPLPPAVPGQPISALAAACWAPAQGGAAAPARARPVVRQAPGAVCPQCVTIVVPTQGTCPECRTAVVARRG